jgi:hypothetical protein
LCPPVTRRRHDDECSNHQETQSFHDTSLS